MKPLWIKVVDMEITGTTTTFFFFCKRITVGLNFSTTWTFWPARVGLPMVNLSRSYHGLVTQQNQTESNTNLPDLLQDPVSLFLRTYHLNFVTYYNSYKQMQIMIYVWWYIWRSIWANLFFQEFYFVSKNLYSTVPLLALFTSNIYANDSFIIIFNFINYIWVCSQSYWYWQVFKKTQPQIVEPILWADRKVRKGLALFILWIVLRPHCS